MRTLLLDTHVLHWAAEHPDRLSPAARDEIGRADELAVASSTWFELAWLRARGRIQGRVPVRAWLDQLSRGVRTLPLGPGVAALAAAIPDPFPRDPIDRIIYATAVEFGLPLVTRDRSMHEAASAGTRVIW